METLTLHWGDIWVSDEGSTHTQNLQNEIFLGHDGKNETSTYTDTLGDISKHFKM